MHFIRRHARRRRRLERPAIELVAVRARPHAGIVLGDLALLFEFGDLAIERRRDFLLRNRPGALGPVAGNRFRLRAPLDRFDQRSASRAFFADSRICDSALSIRNAGGTSPLPRAAWMRPSSPSSCFAYDCNRARYASASAAFSIGWSLSR